MERGRGKCCEGKCCEEKGLDKRDIGVIVGMSHETSPPENTQVASGITLEMTPQGYGRSFLKISYAVASTYPGNETRLLRARTFKEKQACLWQYFFETSCWQWSAL